MTDIDQLKGLSPALREVAKLIVAGKDNDEISDIFGLPKGRVRSYKQRLVYLLAGRGKPGKRRNLDQVVRDRLQDPAVVKRLMKKPDDKEGQEEVELIPWQARRQKIQLFQDDTGQWFIYGEARVVLPATDWQVSLWLELQEERARVRILSQKPLPHPTGG